MTTQNKILDLYTEAFRKRKGFADLWSAKWDEFRPAMQLEGFQMLGRGWYSSVWLCPAGKVYKINSGQQGARDGWIRWIDATRQHAADNPCIPQTGALEFREDRYCIEVERLAPAWHDITPADLARKAEADPALMAALEIALNCLRKIAPDHRFTPSPSLVDCIEDMDFADGAMKNVMMRGDQLVINDPVAYSRLEIGDILPAMSRGLIEWAA